MNRRELFKTIVVGGVGFALGRTSRIYGEEKEKIQERVNTRSQPSQLKITDLRVVNVKQRWIIRIDTNQGLNGYGEVRDGGSPTYP